jgi:hypothetical protein
LGTGTPAEEGRIQPRDGKLQADLQGSYRRSTGFFRGEVELEKPFEPNGGVFSVVIHSTFFVLSKEPTCDRVLKARDLADGKRE